jgi:hypothetical protein
MSDITKRQKGLEWRRGMVLKLSAQGFRQDDIAQILKLDQSVISRDLSWVKKQAQQNVQHFITTQIPLEIDKAFMILDYIMKECAIMEQKTEDKKLRLQILSLMKDVERSKLDLLADTTIAKEIIIDWKQKTEKLLLHQHQQQQQSQLEEEAEGKEDFQDDEEPPPIEPEEDLKEE